MEGKTLLNYLKKYGTPKIEPSEWNNKILTYQDIKISNVEKELKTIYAADTDVNIVHLRIIYNNERYYITEEKNINEDQYITPEQAESGYELIVHEQPTGNNVQGKELPISCLEKLNNNEITLKILVDSEMGE